MIHAWAPWVWGTTKSALYKYTYLLPFFVNALRQRHTIISRNVGLEKGVVVLYVHRFSCPRMAGEHLADTFVWFCMDCCMLYSLLWYVVDLWTVVTLSTTSWNTNFTASFCAGLTNPVNVVFRISVRGWDRKHGQSLEALGHGLYGSITKRSLQNQYINYTINKLSTPLVTFCIQNSSTPYQ